MVGGGHAERPETKTAKRRRLNLRLEGWAYGRHAEATVYPDMGPGTGRRYRGAEAQRGTKAEGAVDGAVAPKTRGGNPELQC